MSTSAVSGEDYVSSTHSCKVERLNPQWRFCIIWDVISRSVSSENLVSIDSNVEWFQYFKWNIVQPFQKQINFPLSILVSPDQHVYVAQSAEVKLEILKPYHRSIDVGSSHLVDVGSYLFTSIILWVCVNHLKATYNSSHIASHNHIISQKRRYRW